MAFQPVAVGNDMKWYSFNCGWVWKKTVDIWGTIAAFAGKDCVKILQAHLRQQDSGFEPWTFGLVSRNAKYLNVFYSQKHKMLRKWNPPA
jgi:hypothetical protein